MKGIVFNAFEEVVVAHRGEDAWEDLLSAAGVDGAYTSLGSYPDDEFTALVASAAQALGMTDDELVRWLGRHTLPLFAERFPDLFRGHESTRSFVLALNDVIHPEVRKVYPGAQVPEFDFDSSSPELLVIGYRSHRQLCSFGEGLLEGAARYFEDHVAIRQPTCTKRGDARCTFEMWFAR